MADVPKITQAASTGAFGTATLVCVGVAGVAGAVVDVLIRGTPFLASALLVLAALTLAFGTIRLRRARRPVLVVASGLLLGIVLIPLVFAAPFLAVLLPQYARDLIHGPNVVLSAKSPAGEYEAYVIDRPSIDGPAQTLYVQRSDGIHFFEIAELPEDVDAVQQISWSPGGDMVVFQTRFALIVANVPGYQTVRIPLGIEWRRSNSGRYWTFTTGGPRRSVAELSFPEAGVIRYRLDSEADARTIRMAAL